MKSLETRVPKYTKRLIWITGPHNARNDKLLNRSRLLSSAGVRVVVRTGYNLQRVRRSGPSKCKYQTCNREEIGTAGNSICVEGGDSERTNFPEGCYRQQKRMQKDSISARKLNDRVRFHGYRSTVPSLLWLSKGEIKNSTKISARCF